MIIFRCPNCKKKFGVPDDYAGRSVHCNQCGKQLVVPKPAAAPSKPQEANIQLQPPMRFDKPKPARPEDSRPATDDSEDLQLAPLPPEPENDNADAGPELKSRTVQEPAAPSGWYWPFLFPLNGIGLAMIGMLVASRFFLWLIIFGAIYHIPVIGLALAMIAAVVSFIIQIYACWYACLCVQLCAQGHTRAPDTLMHDTGGFVEMIKQILRVAAAIGFCILPAALYFYHYKSVDARFWAALAAGWFFLPMTLLSAILYDSLAGLNPFIIVIAIFRLFFKYSLLVLKLSVPVGLLIVVFIYSKLFGMLFILPAHAILLYLAFVGAAMLGRFFYLNEARLNWNV